MRFAGRIRWVEREGLADDVGRLGHEDVARYLTSPEARARRDGRAKRATSVNALRSCLRGFFGYLHRAGIIEADPTRLIQQGRCGSAPPRTLSRDQQVAFIGELERAEGETALRDRALFALLLGTGLRLSEALHLDAEDLDLERGEIQVQRAKGGPAEAVFLPPEAIGALSLYMEERGPTGPLFQNGFGSPLSGTQVRRRLALWLERAGIKRAFSPHVLRHTFATDLYQRTRDVFLVKEALGHRSIESTLVYVRSDRERLREVIALRG